jgi:uncharacterized membrane protein YdjX (TVP38/TMEM64 family)
MIDSKAAENSKEYIRRRRIVGLASLLIFLALSTGLAYFAYRVLLQHIDSPEEFRAYIESFGWKGRFVLLGLQCLQIVVALIPGEIVEMGAGYAFGPIEGTLLCMGGVAIASTFVFALTKRWGIRLVELFISKEKINELRFINSERKLKRMTFILFFIPGTPKDLFTYFFGLTRLRLHEFLAISIIARIPSVVSSTIGGHIISSRDYLAAGILFAVTGLVSLGGMALYSRIARSRRDAHDNQVETEND